MTTPPVVFVGRTRWPDALPSISALRPAADELASGIGALTGRGPRPAVVAVTKNQRSMLSVRSQEGRFEVRVSWRLLDSPQVVVRAVAAWRTSGAFTDELRDTITGLSVGPAVTPAVDALRPEGARHDLRSLLNHAATWLPEYSAQVEALHITWGRATRAKRSLRLGSARPSAALIRIHPTLDRHIVPEYVTQMVVYHEVCHCIAPPLSPSEARARGERQRIHHAEFRALEARYPQLDEANQWVRDNFALLAQS